jgi:hypothetical protein
MGNIVQFFLSQQTAFLKLPTRLEKYGYKGPSKALRKQNEKKNQ